MLSEAASTLRKALQNLKRKGVKKMHRARILGAIAALALVAVLTGVVLALPDSGRTNVSQCRSAAGEGFWPTQGGVFQG